MVDSESHTIAGDWVIRDLRHGKCFASDNRKRDEVDNDNTCTANYHS